MREIDELTLISGSDIPFPEARISIHQPRFVEISMIGEESFHIGSHFLCFDKNSLSEQDKINSSDQSNFDIFMSVMNSKEKARHKADALIVFSMLFPNAKILLQKDKILLQDGEIMAEINCGNFDLFQNIVSQIFCLNEGSEEQHKYNPQDALAERIAKKIAEKKSKAKKQALAGSNEKINIYSRFISILAVGLKKDINSFMNYTVYQLRDEYSRFMAKYDFDIYIKAKLAGAEDLEEVENWMKDIHSIGKN